MAGLLATVIEGEDKPLAIEYRDDAGNLIAPDGSPTNSTTPSEPSITITDEAGTNVVNGVQMPEQQAGEYEYVWDTAADSSGPDVYTVEVTADFNSETDIERGKVRVE